MRAESIEFLKGLLDAPGPSGFETVPARVWREEAEKYADQVEVDTSGNSVAAFKPDERPRVMLAGHIDEIGIMVKHVDDKGYIYFSTIGGWDKEVFAGQRVLILTAKGRVPGVIGKKPIHLTRLEDHDAASTLTDLWLDIGTRTRNETLRKVRIGDPAVILSTTLELPRNRIVSRSVDNRIGAFTVLETLRRLSRKKFAASVYSVATTREEIAWTGGGAKTSASRIEPDVAIVVDVTNATDHPTVETKEHGEVKIGKGPVLSRGSAIHPVVFDILVTVAENAKIPYQIQAAPRDTGTDADAIHTARAGIPTGLVSIPNRYMHSPNEMIDLADVDNTVRLLERFARKIDSKTDFRPV